MKQQNGVMINIDFCSSINPFINGLVDRGNVTEEGLYPMVDPYAGTQVTDLFINTFGQYSNTPSLPLKAIDGQPLLTLSFDVKPGYQAAAIVYLEAGTY